VSARLNGKAPVTKPTGKFNKVICEIIANGKEAHERTGGTWCRRT